MPETTDMVAATDERMPVTLLTGFLGAGKTTLLNTVLADASTGRVAVIVNEFGEAGLDHDLIEYARDEVILMRSGCLCCSIRGDLAQTIAGLLARWNSGKLGFERIVIETTGPGTLDAQFEAVSQVAMADLVVISKADITSEADLRAFERRLSGINPTARFLRAAHGIVPAGSLWQLGASEQVQSPTKLADWLTPGPASPPDDPLANLSGLAPLPGPHAPEVLTSHDQRIGSASIILDDPIPDVMFDLWLDTLVALRGPDLLRVKGIVFLEDMDMPFVFHGVQHVFDPPLPLRNWTGTDRRSRIVVIARDLSRPELQRSLDMLRGQFPAKQPESDAGGGLQDYGMFAPKPTRKAGHQ